MTQLPLPPIDLEVDLSDFEFMPLDVRRLRDSKLAASVNGEAFRCCVLLWCAAWHQLPAGSLPDDDIELAQLAGFGRMVTQWKKIRTAALYGWTKHSDGRLYHSVVVEKAKESWRKKLDERYRRECDRLRKENKRRAENKEAALLIPSFDQWNSARMAPIVPTETAPIPTERQRKSVGHPQEPDDRPPDSLLKGQGRDLKVREGTGMYVAPDTRDDPDPAEAQESIQASYPRFTGRQDWLSAFHHCQLIVERGWSTWSELLLAAIRYRDYVAAGGASGPQYVLTPAKFFGAADKPWAQPWESPPTKAEAQRDSNIDASRTWLAEQERKDAAG